VKTLVALGLLAAAQVNAQRPPNIVVIFIDDLGYADIGAFGASSYPPPNLARMAREGMRLTDFVVPSAVCSASRASLLTGCYHRRIGFAGALGPGAKHGLHQDEVTIAELCKQKGYATACFGKWHLGHHPKFLPLQHGFDEYFGLPYSNDMWPLHPNYAHLPKNAASRKRGYPPLPLIEGDRVIDDTVTGEEQEQLTTQYTERAVRFINRNRERPFFLYVPHSMVHVPLFVSDKFKGKSKAGLFGDVMMEVDWSVGLIQEALKANELDEHTLVVFTSDNGPWLSYGDHAGSALPLREGKGTMFEGGCRVPTLARWPGRVPAGSSCAELASTIDLLPTIAALIGAKLPDHKIDGKDIRPLLFAEPGARSPHEAFYCYYGGGQLQAVRDRRFKLHLKHRYRTLKGRPGGSEGSPVRYEQAEIDVSLFDLHADIGETRVVSEQYPKETARLMKHVERARQDLGDRLKKTPGTGRRPAGKLGPEDKRLVW